MKTHLLVWLIVLAAPSLLSAQDESYKHTEDVIYHRKHGTALTLDVFQPKEDANGAGIVFVVSGGWFSSHAMIQTWLPRVFVERGYTVFAVVHGSQPQFAIDEIVEDMHRAVRFVRHHAKEYDVDPNRLGIYGASAGGHLSLMIGTSGKAGNERANDPVDRQSSRVQAVACFFPPTDFLNYGEEGKEALGSGTLSGFRGPFQFKRLNSSTRSFDLITDAEERRKIGRQISPINHVSKDDPPTLIIHGDADNLVPIQQAEIIVEKLKEVGVESKLIVKEGAGHGWADIQNDLEPMADWFDEYLLKAKSDEE